jgi:hypothetical protein
MSKITPISPDRLKRVFEKAGFRCVRIEGVPRPVVIPDWKEIPVFIIKNNLRTAGLNRDEYFRLLAEL